MHYPQADCKLEVNMAGPAIDAQYELLKTIDDVHNYGNASRSSWRYATVDIPPTLEEGHTVQIKAVYNPVNGAFALEGMKVHTEQKCYPRYCGRSNCP